MTDEYAESAEFIDILIGPHWNHLGPALTDAIKDIGPGTGPVVDIGAGSGRGTAVIGDALPDAEIFAVEPSAGIRSALLAKVNAHDALRSRVTVLPEEFLDSRLPDRIGVVVAMNVIGHFSPAERAEIWSLLARRLAPNGRAVLNLQPPSDPVSVPDTLTSTVHIGRRRYEGWARAEPAEDGTLTWHMTYRTFQDDELVDEREVSYSWHPISEPQLRAELDQAGFRLLALQPADLGMYAITWTDA
ncbi:methyltransferase [Saccharopolyspora sp. 5N708]|uniref:methyltransferase n=1 Tax=Saccharopolyspora sp. 5N708 TaxID=3457424 RepID=UPI003FD0D56C